MPLIPDALVALIQTEVVAKMTAISGHSPLSQPNPSYFIAMCTGIGYGIALGCPTIAFTSSDNGLSGAPPVPGTGAGVGIMVDDTFFAQNMYETINTLLTAQFGHTENAPYPPSPTQAGAYTAALCQGVAAAIKTYFSTAWILTSTDPLIYMGTGTIGNGQFTGVVSSAIQSQIIAASPTLAGPAWPTIAQAIAESYTTTITQHSTGTLTITGVCAPSLAQVCGLGPMSGTGAGVAA